MTTTVKQRFGEYTLHEKIGIGATADVWVAVKDGAENFVALKVYAKIKHLENVAFDIFYEEFEKTKLLNHPNVLNTVDFFVSNHSPALALPLYSNCLEKELTERKIKFHKGNSSTNSYFNDEEILDIVVQISSGLDYLHKQNIIHNDIKPANIVFNRLPYGIIQYAIIDFGISIDIKNYVKNIYHKEILNSKTLLYAAPEKLEENHTEPKSDIFSLGMLIYELAGGRNKNVCAGDIVQNGGRIFLENRETTNPIQLILCACLKKNPNDRPCAEILHKMVVKYQKDKNINHLKCKNHKYTFLKTIHSFFSNIFKNK